MHVVDSLWIIGKIWSFQTQFPPASSRSEIATQLTAMMARRFGLEPPTLAPKHMRFTPQFLDELKARLPVSEVVGRRVKLKKAGREWKGLSPFNKEKTPSFFVNDQKQAWFDFSSGKNGNIFDFVMLTEGVTFPGGRRAARQHGRRAAAEIFQGGGGARGEAQDAA